jgi:MFS transporter, PHS family, inorganic phosphate transporter
MLIIFATIMSLTTPTGQLSANSAIIYLTIWRIILGIGVGGDYPMSASVTSDRANIRKVSHDPPQVCTQTDSCCL